MSVRWKGKIVASIGGTASSGGDGSSGGGTSDHRDLTHRDAEDQHPIEAISGLKEVLETIPKPMTAEQLRKILMN